MEKFLDELILSERKRGKKKVLDKQIDLERDLPEQYLQTVVMSDKATSIKIPAFMKDLPEKLVEQKYEFEPIPQIIKSTQNGNINFTFSLLDVSVEPGQLGEICQGCKRAWRRILPEIIFMRKGGRTLTASGFIGWNIPIMRQEESYIISCFMQRQSRHLWGV